MFERIKNYFEGDKPANEVSEDKNEHSLEDLAKSVNIFISSYGLKVDDKIVNPMLLRAGLSEKEIDDMIVATHNQMPDNGMTVDANMAYLDSLRVKIAETIRQLSEKV